MWERCDSSVTVFPSSLIVKVRSGMFDVCSGVVGFARLTYAVGSIVKKHTAFSMASLAADIRFSSSVSIALSVTCLLASAFSLSVSFCCSAD